MSRFEDNKSNDLLNIELAYTNLEMKYEILQKTYKKVDENSSSQGILAAAPRLPEVCIELGASKHQSKVHGKTTQKIVEYKQNVDKQSQLLKTLREQLNSEGIVSLEKNKKIKLEIAIEEALWNNYLLYIQNPDYALVYIWKSKKFICALSGCCNSTRVGHVSMELFSGDGARIPHGYISIWPSKHKRKRCWRVPDTTANCQWIDDFGTDRRGESPDGNSDEAPSETFAIFGLDIDAIYREYIEMRSGNITWTIRGSGFSKCASETNCSGLITKLLIDHGIESFFREERPWGKIAVIFCGTDFHHSPCDEKVQDIVETIKTEPTRWDYVKRVFFILIPLAYIVALTKIAQNNISSNISENGAAIGTILGILYFALFHLWPFYINAKRHLTFLGNCGGVTPDDTSYLLNFLQDDAKSRGTCNYVSWDKPFSRLGIKIVKLEAGEDGYVPGYDGNLYPFLQEKNVPRDNSSLFWAVALALLVPTLNRGWQLVDWEFIDIYFLLFGRSPATTDIIASDTQATVKDNDSPMQAAKKALRDYKGNEDEKKVTKHFKTSILDSLVCTIFRNRVVDHMCQKWSKETQRDIAVQSGKKDWETYAETMRNPETLGGSPEIKAMSELTKREISVYSADRKNPQIVPSKSGIHLISFKNYYRFTVPYIERNTQKTFSLHR